MADELDPLIDRVSRLEAQMEDMHEFRAETRAALASLRSDLADLHESIATGLGEVKDQLRDVVIGSLNSMPPWAAKVLTLAGIIIGALAAILGGAAATGHL